MSVPVNDSLGIRAPRSADDRYMNNIDNPVGVPYISREQANAMIDVSYRHPYLTVNIAGVEYWYNGSTADAALVPKKVGDQVVTLTANGYIQMVQDSYIVAIIVIPSQNINFRAGSSPNAEDFIPETPILANTPAAFSVALYRLAGQQVHFGGIAPSSTKIIIKTV